MESPQMYDNNQNNLTNDIKKVALAMAAQNTNNTNNNNGNNNNNNNNSAINQNLKQNGQHHNGNGVMQNGSTNMHQKPHQQHQQLHQQQQQQQIQVQQPSTQQYNQNDLEELTSQEISLDLAHLIDDQFRDQESLALFSEMVPAVANGNANGLTTQTAAAAVKVLQLQQARLSQRQNPGYSQLAYMPGCVTGPTYSNTSSADDTSSSDGTNIKEEPVEPLEIRRLQQLSANGGQFLNGGSNMYQSSYLSNGNGTSTTGNGTSFTSLTPASVLQHQSHVPGQISQPQPAHLSNFQKHSKHLLHSRKNSLKNVDKGTDEYRRRRERNNIAVRKSREKAKVRSREVEEKVKALLKEKDALMRRLEETTNEIQLHKQLYMHLMNHSNPEINQICRSALNLVNMQSDQGM